MSKTVIHSGVLAAVLAGALASCTMVVEDDRPSRPPLDRNFCTREYDPVCGVRNGDRQTFPNACEADVSGYRIVHPGQCRGRDPGPVPPPRPNPDPGPRVCTRIYDPVCAVDRGHRRTFPNACEAEAAGYRITHPGKC